MTETFSDYRADQLPHVVLTYLEAHNEQRHAEAASHFAPDATVVDDGKTYEGIEAIRAWLENSSSEYTWTNTPTGQQITDDENVTVRIRVDGTFPGGSVVLRYQFELDGDAIQSLVIEV